MMGLSSLVERAIADPSLVFDLRGRLEAALFVLVPALQAKLMFDYAEHVLWICEALSGDDHRFRAAIGIMREYLDGQVTIAQVVQVRSDFYDAFAQFNTWGQAPSVTGITAGWAFLRAIQACCQKELENVGAVMPGISKGTREPDVMQVATIASCAAGLYAGGADNLPTDPELLEDAKRRGKAAAEAETEWQLAHLLEVVRLEGSAG